MELSDNHKISQEKRNFKISDVLITAWSRVQVLAGPPKKHEGSGLRASFLLIHTVLCSSGRFCLPPLRQILLSAANCIRSRRLLNEYFPPSRYTGREME